MIGDGVDTRLTLLDTLFYRKEYGGLIATNLILVGLGYGGSLVIDLQIRNPSRCRLQTGEGRRKPSVEDVLM